MTLEINIYLWRNGMFKKTGRIGIILIILILAAGLFLGGCKQGPNLRGVNIVEASFWQNYNVNTYEPRNEGEERDLEFRRKIFAEQGFTFEVVEISDFDNYLPVVVNNIMSGNKNYSIYQVEPGQGMTLFKQGLLYPVSDSKAVNFNNREAIAEVTPLYNGLVQEFMTIGGKTYGWDNGLPNDNWGQAMLFFNAKHLQEVGLSPEYIYDLQKNNNWTWDTFLDLCRKLTRDTNNDGITDIYALPCDDAREIIRGFIYGNGGNLVTFDAQGKASSSANTPAVLEALAFYNTLITEGLVLTQPTYDWGWNWTAFYDQRVAMTFDPEWRKGQADQFDGGYVLPPRGPRSSQIRLDAGALFKVIPSIFTPAEVDVILKAHELFNTPTDTDWLGGHYWASSNLRDVTETVVMSRDAKHLVLRDLALIPGFPFDDFINEFRDGLGTTNPAQHVEAWLPRMNAAIDDFNR
jgi:ABC-type glycerol-3-phosphate transport system substrate-binding protein